MAGSRVRFFVGSRVGDECPCSSVAWVPWWRFGLGRDVVEQQILVLFRKLKQRDGAAFLFITHDMSIAATLCDRIAVMYAGELIETGDPRRPGNQSNGPRREASHHSTTLINTRQGWPRRQLHAPRPNGK
jgi:ABC-type glutathione transport system ATPase component